MEIDEQMIEAVAMEEVDASLDENGFYVEPSDENSFEI